MSFGGTGRAHTLGIGEILRVSGIKGGEEPAILGGIQPTMIVADFSRSYTAEPFEGRGFAGLGNLSVPAGGRGALALWSRAPGGTVVEDLYYTTSIGGGGSFLGLYFLDILAVAANATMLGGSFTEQHILNIGGRAVTSQVWKGTLPGGYSPTGAGPCSTTVNAFGAVLPGPSATNRLYIPPGSTLLLVTAATSDGVTGDGFMTTFRDLPAPLGNP